MAFLGLHVFFLAPPIDEEKSNNFVEAIHQQSEMLDYWYLLVKVLEASNLERHAG
jgi:hypothetical protein